MCIYMCWKTADVCRFLLLLFVIGSEIVKFCSVKFLPEFQCGNSL